MWLLYEGRSKTRRAKKGRFGDLKPTAQVTDLRRIQQTKGTAFHVDVELPTPGATRSPGVVDQHQRRSFGYTPTLPLAARGANVGRFHGTMEISFSMRKETG